MFLKKIDAPKFEGDILDYPEFQRRWKSLVPAAGLGKEAELDRLRDNVPEESRKLLIGQVDMEGAWKVLDQMYGNRTMLANKLKTKLKTIMSIGKEDHDIVIKLVIEVKGIVNRLTTLDLHHMLRYDDEYISAIFKALPRSDRTEWLKFGKEGFKSEWEALMVFLEEAQDRATNTKSHLNNEAAVSQPKEEIRCRKCNKKGHIKRDCTVAAVRVQKDPEDSSDEINPKNDSGYIKKLTELCGKCPLCKSRHEFTRKRDNKDLPSDRFMCCADFRKMTEQERGQTVEKFKACARCLSWNHKRDSKDCKAPKNSCRCPKDSSTCGGDHHTMVCKSGVVYCNTVKVDKSEEKQSGQGEVTLLLLQDVKVRLGEKSVQARGFFDSGSNQVLVRDGFGRDNKLRNQRVKY